MDKSLAIQKEVQRILGTEEVYLVGGSVRDLVMGNEPKDYDFTTPMLPDDVEAKATAAGRHVYAIGKKFGTIGFKVSVDRPAIMVVQDHSGHKEWKNTAKEVFEYVEVTTFRSEVYTSKSRKPEVQFVPSLDEDLARRDFTFNAMILKSDGKIYDPYGGKLHIHSKMIKTVGMPKDRIQEDPLRMLRAARFAARYDFTIDPNFIGKARQLADRIHDVSVERWVQELDKLFTSKHAWHGLNQLQDMGVFARIMPELVYDQDVSLDNDTKEDFRTVYTNPFDCTEQQTFENADAAWAYLLDHINLPMLIKQPKQTQRYVKSGIAQRLKFSNERTKIILGQVSKETMDK